MKHGRLNALTNPRELSKIAESYDKLTGRIEAVPTLRPGESITYSVKGKNESSYYVQFLANTKSLPFSRGGSELSISIPNMGTRTLPFRIVTQSDVYEPVVNKAVTAATVSKGQVINPVSTIQKIDDKSNSISGFVKPEDMEDYNRQINGGGNTTNSLPNTTAGTSNNLSRLNVKNVEWVGGSNQIGSGIGEKIAVKATVNGKEVYLPVPEDMELSRLGSALTEQDKQAILAHNDLQGKAQITGTKVGLSKQLKTIYKDDEGGDSVDISEVFFENINKATATKPNVDPKSDGSVVVSPVTGNDKINISYTPTTSTTANTPTQITIKKSGTTWENSDPLPDGVTLDKTTGNVTISEEAVKDNTPVNATSYNFNSDGAITTATAKAPYRAKTDRFYAVEGENSSQLNARDFVVDGNGVALPSTTTVTWKPGTLDLSTPGTKTATLLVTKGSENKEVEYKYTVYERLHSFTRNGKTGKFYAFKADRDGDRVTGGNYANNFGGNTNLYVNTNGKSWVYEYHLNDDQSTSMIRKEGSPEFSSLWHTNIVSDPNNQPLSHHTTYKVIATYPKGRFGDVSTGNAALTSTTTYEYTVVDPVAKKVYETIVGDKSPLTDIISHPGNALQNSNPRVDIPADTSYSWVSAPDDAMISAPGVYKREITISLPESTTSTGTGRNSRNVPVTIKVRPNPPQISTDQVTNTGGLPSRDITVTDALPGAQVTLTINGRQLASK